VVQVEEGEEVGEGGWVGGGEVVDYEDFWWGVSMLDGRSGGDGGVPLCPERRSSREAWEPR
jgi:hypothetical protein